MGSGLSMASVNKIKELAEQREYSLALDIVDSQDLSKSLNPQFLRICGDIYINNNRFADARKILLMAHKLAPEGKRVIYSLAYLYLKMGYKDLAKRYYDLYMYDSDDLSQETNQIKYIFGKSDKVDFEELYNLLAPDYIHNLDYDWSFETFLLLTVMEREQEADVLAEDFIATYKNTRHSQLIEDIRTGKSDAKSYFYVFPEESFKDDDDEQEELRQEEKVLLEADDLRVNPKEAEITIMVDDYDEVDIGAKHRLKKFLKNEEKEKKKELLEEQAAKEQQSQDTSTEEEITSAEESSDNVEKEITSVQENSNDESVAVQEGVQEEVSEEDNVESEDRNAVKGFFKRVFAKKKKAEETANPEEEDGSTDDAPDKDETEPNISEETCESQESNNEDVEVAIENGSTEEDDSEGQEEEANQVMTKDDPAEEKEVLMHEIHTNKHNPIVSIDDGDDGFAAEADTIEDLVDGDFENPFDSISVLKKEKEEPTFVPKRKAAFDFDEIDFSAEEDEFEVDDFSAEEDEFGHMESIQEDEYLSEEEESEPETEVVEAEEPFEEEIIEDDFESEIEVVEEEESFEEEIIEDDFEPETEVVEGEESFEEEEIIEEVLDESEEYEEALDETEIEPIETDLDTEVQSYTEPEVEEMVEIKSSVEEEIKTTYPKSSLDFPVFKSSLFPNYNQEVKQVENKFNEVMSKGQDKIQENLLKEEQMQREAEALLASLGIDLSSVTVTSDSIDSINKTLYNEPSRDEIKSSLKIDSVKKDLLKKLKEYR